MDTTTTFIMRQAIRSIWLTMLFATFAMAQWDGTSIVEPSKTTIEGRQYYEISTAEELAWFARCINSKDTARSAILTADIDLNMNSWTPIGDTLTNAFDGIFDGNGHSISGVSVSNKMYAGLFGVIDVGTVKNLIVENSKIIGYYGKNGEKTSDYDYNSYTGGIVAYAKERSIIENVVNKATLAKATNYNKNYDEQYTGGIVGYSKGLIKNCTNEGDLYSDNIKTYLGGICGYSNNHITNSSNTGSIRGGYYTGGISGYGSIVDSSSNSGLIYGNHYIGGICGNCSATYSQNYGSIQNSSFQKNEVYAGGISGRGSRLKMCINYGDITIKSDTTIFVGGIAAICRHDTQYLANYGKLNATSQKNKAYLGGIVGQVEDQSSAQVLEDFYNQGRLSSSHYAAGITAVLPQTNISIKNIYVATDSINAPHAAGLINYNSVTSTVKNGFLDTTLLSSNIPLIEDNVGISYNIEYKSTEELQTDSMAYILDDLSDYLKQSNSNKSLFYQNKYIKAIHWSRGNGYPIFGDSIHNPIYKIFFINDADSVYQYTDSSSHIYPFPQKNDHVWLNKKKVSGYIDDLIAPDSNKTFVWQDSVLIDSNTTFTWSDSQAISVPITCNDKPENDLKCCMEYMFNFMNEYDSVSTEYYHTIHKMNYTSSSRYVLMPVTNCLDKNSNGILDGLDSSSDAYSTIQSFINSIQIFRDQLLSSNSMEELSSSSVIPHSSTNESSSSFNYSSMKESSSSKETESYSSANSSSNQEFTSSSSTQTPHESSSSKTYEEKSSSSKSNDLTTTSNETHTPSWSIHTKGKQIFVNGLQAESAYTLFDMQGHILRTGNISSSTPTINVFCSGIYIIKINHKTKILKIK